ncbi:hypothetical protein U1Q18_021975 [Sarracenia purpurea var. burkii]
MAVWQIQRRLLSLFSSRQPQAYLRNVEKNSRVKNYKYKITPRDGAYIDKSLPQTEPSWEFLPSANSFFSRDELWKRRIRTLTTEPGEQAVQDVEGIKTSTSSSEPDSSKAPSNTTSNESNDDSAVKFKATSNLKVSSRHDLAMIFTCKVCETRSIKTVCRESYENGVVLARCGGCSNLHLIADHLGWFGKPGNVEDLLAARGEEVKKGSVDTLNLTLEDLAGKDFGKMDG